MMMSSKVLAIAVVAAAPLLAGPAAAAPLGASLALKNTATAAPLVEQVQWRRGWGWGPGPFVAGAIIGGALAAGAYPYYTSGYYPGYYAAPVYAAPPPGYVAVAPGGGGGDIGYCQQRFRSYDPASGTYLGFDGARHPCP